MTTIIVELHSNKIIELQDDSFDATELFNALTAQPKDENGNFIQQPQHIHIAGQIFSKIDIKNVMTKETYDAARNIQ